MFKKRLYLVYVPVPTKEFGENLIHLLLAKRMIACANLLSPHTAYYMWDQELKKEEEFLVLLKTTKKHLKSIEEEILKIHPYDCPCILSIKVKKSNVVFRNWVNQEVSILTEQKDTKNE